MPAAIIPGVQQYGEQKVALILRERALPATIMVNRHGKRFVNEATNYNAIAGAFHHLDPVQFEYGNLPCWIVFDSRMVREFGFLDVAAGGDMPAWVPSAPTLAALAQQLGIPAAALEDTVARWNNNVATGSDPDFARGDSAYDGFNGDITHYPGKESTLGPIGAAPFYALPLESSTLGTKGGPRTNRHAAVLDVDGHPHPRPVRGRQRDGRPHRHGVRWRRRHTGPGDRVWICGRAACCNEDIIGLGGRIPIQDNHLNGARAVERNRARPPTD